MMFLPWFARKRFLCLAGLVVASLCGILCTQAHADTITDGGFEAAGGGNVYFAGQSIDNGLWNVGQGAVYIDSLDPYVYAGNNAVNLTLANLYVPNSISQIVSTVAGQQYVLTFFADADAANTFAVLLNGSSLAGAPSSIVQNGFSSATSNSSQFMRYTESFRATSNSTNLTFLASADPSIGSPTGSVMVDDVAATAVTPEPSSITLVLTGALGLAGVIRRKRFVRS